MIRRATLPLLLALTSGCPSSIVDPGSTTSIEDRSTWRSSLPAPDVIEVFLPLALSISAAAPITAQANDGFVVQTAPPCAP